MAAVSLTHGDVDGMLGEVSRLLRRLDAPDAEMPGAAWLSATLRSVAETQARLLRSFEFQLQGQENAISEIRQQTSAENARRGSRLVELTEILAGHGGVLVELQQYRKEEPARRRSLAAEMEGRLQGQEAMVVGLAQRLERSEAVAEELRSQLAERGANLEQVRAECAATGSRVVRAREELQDQRHLHEELSAAHGQSIHALQQQQQLSSHALAELQRWVAGRQRSRVRRLEADIISVGTIGAEAPAASARGSRAASSSPGLGRRTGSGLIASTGVARFHEGGADSRSAAGGSLNVSVDALGQSWSGTSVNASADAEAATGRATAAVLDVFDRNQASGGGWPWPKDGLHREEWNQVAPSTARPPMGSASSFLACAGSPRTPVLGHSMASSTSGDAAWSVNRSPMYDMPGTAVASSPANSIGNRAAGMVEPVVASAFSFGPRLEGIAAAASAPLWTAPASSSASAPAGSEAAALARDAAFAAIDENGDGVITRAEWSRAMAGSSQVEFPKPTVVAPVVMPDVARTWG